MEKIEKVGVVNGKGNREIAQERLIKKTLLGGRTDEGKHTMRLTYSIVNSSLDQDGETKKD